ncbi:hypothetical protein Ctob_002725 [Chrysochromulina tobinii]|uniref:Uncharacterized protein n=1 Tax=Chrysochromulina tobinii TaxID=1460289 RepID=A0A0M0JPA3_9EUKA|nr:hypothetical protein Ctob_002725 [Chrysochromulina tobinii]|eukprot:KOO28117.1 hypothetical protein Ctob_002725 [Chrysochromulina sp. CCMP291]
MAGELVTSHRSFACLLLSVRRHLPTATSRGTSRCSNRRHSHISEARASVTSEDRMIPVHVPDRDFGRAVQRSRDALALQAWCAVCTRFTASSL